MLQASARPTARRGAAVLEFALVAPLVFLFVLALIELGRGLMVTHILTKAARQGCRVGIIEGKSTSVITTAVNNALSSVGISGDSVTVQVNDGAADALAANAGDEITVLVMVPVNRITWVPVTNFLSGSLSGQYTLRRE
jgi:Flp pilus assembly protein TadG